MNTQVGSVSICKQRPTSRFDRRRAHAFASLTGLIAALIVVKAVIYVVASQPFGGAEHALCQWDCWWYVHTMVEGYDPEPRMRQNIDFANWAFFPLFPLLGRAVMRVTSLTPFWSGTAVSVSCFAAFAVLSSRYRALTRPEGRLSTWITLLLIYPFSFYFFMVYSESLYLLVTISLLLAIEARSFEGACALTSFATAARPTGVAAIPALLVIAAVRTRAVLRTQATWSSRTRPLIDLALALAMAPLGLALYMAYLYWLTGDALAFSHAQRSWDRSFVNPLKLLYWSFLKDDWSYLHDPEMPQSKAYAALYVLVAAAACLWLLWRRRLAETWLLASTVAMALSTSVDSMPRYVMANPVFLLAAGDLADRITPATLRVGLAVLCVLIQVFLLHQWFIGSTLLM